jgi:hypothetical protein
VSLLLLFGSGEAGTPAPVVAAQPLVEPALEAHWTFVAIDRFGNELGELRRAHDRQVTPRPINGLGTAQLRLRLDDPQSLLWQDGRNLLKVYELDGNDVQQTRFVGPMTSYEEVDDDQNESVVLGFTSGGWRLADRLIGKSATGFTGGSTPTSLVDRAELMARVLDAVNAENWTGIARGTIGLSGGTTYVSDWLYKKALDAWTELAVALDAPDWEIEPLEPLDYGGAIGRLNTAAFFGANEPNAVWEYGIGKHNVKTWRRTIDPKLVANSVYALTPGYPDNDSTPPANAQDATSIAARGLHEDVIAADLSVPQLRTALAQQHVAVRKAPRQVITFDPRLEIAKDLRYRVDYKEGDLVWFHALREFPIYDATGTFIEDTQQIDVVDAALRIYAVTFNIDDAGNATPSFTLLEEG